MLSLLYSEVMEIIGKSVTWHSDVVSIVGDLMCVHHRSWYLNCTDEVEEVITQVIGELLNLVLRHICSVGYNIIMDGERGGYCCLMSDHVEIEACLVAWVFYQTLINNSARCRVLILVVALFCEPGIDSLVD